jgi:hypothetical protein
VPGARGVVKSLEVPDFDALMAASAAITRYGRSLRIPLGAQITADRGDEHSSSRPEESAHLPRCTVQSHVKVDPPRFAYLATPGAHDLSLLLPTDGCELGLREVVEGEVKVTGGPEAVGIGPVAMGFGGVLVSVGPAIPD